MNFLKKNFENWAYIITKLKSAVFYPLICTFIELKAKNLHLFQSVLFFNQDRNKACHCNE